MFPDMPNLLPPILLMCCALPQMAVAQQVQYSGNVFTEFGSPSEASLVVFGTFASEFNPLDYSCVYGDEDCNLNLGAYDMAVNDGNFSPIGSGAFTDQSGFFTDFAVATAPVGSQIWLFAFESNIPDSATQVLATSSDPSWLVSDGSMSLNAADANTFVLGHSHPDGVQLNVVPFPEPNSSIVLVLSTIIAGCSRFRKNS